MKPRRFFVATLVALAASRGAAQSLQQNESSATSPPSNSPTCEQLGFVSVSVRGAPNAFCVQANTCNTNYIGSCPGANALDVNGVALPTGSCCAALESTGDVGCVGLALVKSGTFQCLTHAGAGDAAVVVDVSTATPPPTPTPTTTPTRAPQVSLLVSDGSSRPSDGNAGDSVTAETTTPSPPATTAPKPETTTRAPAATTKAPSSPPSISDKTDQSQSTTMSSSSSSSSSADSSSSAVEPEAGVDPTITSPTSPRPEQVPSPIPAPAGPLVSLEPIPDSPPLLGASGGTSTASKVPNAEPFSSSGSSSSTSSGFSPALNSNVILALVVGAVASVAVILGAFMLRRRRVSTSETSTSSPQTSSRAGKLTSPDMPTLTLDGDDDFLDDLQFRQTDAFSPIFVQPTYSYAESRTPGHDRESYLL